MVDLVKDNLSYYTVPVAFWLAFLPQAFAITQSGRSYDLANPRKLLENVQKDTTMRKETMERIKRASAASLNGFETLGLYAAAVVAANIAGVPVPTLNKLSLGYLASRLTYNFIYIQLQNNRNLAPLRPLAWFASTGISMYLFILAGQHSQATLL